MFSYNPSLNLLCCKSIYSQSADSLSESDRAWNSLGSYHFFKSSHPKLVKKALCCLNEKHKITDGALNLTAIIKINNILLMQMQLKSLQSNSNCTNNAQLSERTFSSCFLPMKTCEEKVSSLDDDLQSLSFLRDFLDENEEKVSHQMIDQNAINSMAYVTDEEFAMLVSETTK